MIETKELRQLTLIVKTKLSTKSTQSNDLDENILKDMIIND